MGNFTYYLLKILDIVKIFRCVLYLPKIFLQTTTYFNV